MSTGSRSGDLKEHGREFRWFCKSEYASVYRAAFAFTGDKDAALDALADLPVAAVADLMGASEGTVKTHLSRGRQSLSRLLAPSEGESRP